MASADFRRNSIFALFAKIGGAAASLLTTMLLARLLTKADFAGYAMAYTVVMLGGILGPLGMGNAILRFAGFHIGAQQMQAARRVTWRGVGLGSCGLLVVAVTLALSHGPLSHRLASWPANPQATLLISIWMFGNGMLMLTTSALRAYGRIGLGSVIEITVPRFAVLMATASVFLLKIESLTVILGVSSVVVLLICVWSVFVLWKTTRVGIQLEVDGDDVQIVPARELRNCALPLLGSHLLYQAMTDSTLFFVAYYCSVEATALYAAAYRIWGVFGLPQSAVASAIQGRIAELDAQGDKQAVESLIRGSANLAMWPTAAAAAVVCLMSGSLMSVLYGPSFASAAQVLTILCLIQCVTVALGPSDHLLAMSGKQIDLLLAAMVSTALALFLGWLLISNYGTVGAAWAAGAATIAFKLLVTWRVSKWFGIRTWIGYLPTTVMAKSTPKELTT